MLILAEHCLKHFEDTLEDTEFHWTHQVINVRRKRFCRDTSKLLSKNLNFAQKQKITNKDELNN